MFFQTLANAIFTFGDAIADSFVGMIGNFAMKPIRQALMVWSRASELTADRVACLFVPAATLAKALARISMIPKYIVDGMDFDAWGEQGRDYEALKNGTTWNKIVHWMADYDADHPYSPVRVFEAKKWEQTETCNLLRSRQLKLEFTTEETTKAKPVEGGLVPSTEGTDCLLYL